MRANTILRCTCGGAAQRSAAARRPAETACVDHIFIYARVFAVAETNDENIFLWKYTASTYTIYIMKSQRKLYDSYLFFLKSIWGARLPRRKCNKMFLIIIINQRWLWKYVEFDKKQMKLQCFLFSSISLVMGTIYSVRFYFVRLA